MTAQPSLQGHIINTIIIFLLYFSTKTPLNQWSQPSAYFECVGQKNCTTHGISDEPVELVSVQKKGDNHATREKKRWQISQINRKITERTYWPKNHSFGPTSSFIPISKAPLYLSYVINTQPLSNLARSGPNSNRYIQININDTYQNLDSGSRMCINTLRPSPL